MAKTKNNASLEKQVRDAIRKLTNDGKQVTNQAVRDILGGWVVSRHRTAGQADQGRARSARASSASRT